MAGFFGIPNEDTSEQQRRQNEFKERSRQMHSGSVFLRGRKVTHDQTDTASAAASVVCLRFFLQVVPHRLSVYGCRGHNISFLYMTVT